MAFKKRSHGNRKIQLVSLIDLIFILLIFFIMTSVLIKITRGEAKLYIPTPKNEPGEAQVLIQILDRDKYLWLDHTAVDTLHRYRSELPDANDSKIKVDLLLSKMVVDVTGLKNRLHDLESLSIRRLNKEYFVLIRCPDDLPFYYATEIVEMLVDNPTFEYGCVSGTISDIKESKNFSIHGNVIQIDF